MPVARSSVEVLAGIPHSPKNPHRDFASGGEHPDRRGTGGFASQEQIVPGSRTGPPVAEPADGPSHLSAVSHPLRSVSRRARIGARSSLTVTFTAVDPTQPLPFGADRALLGWIQTLAYQSPHIRFSSLTEFFRAFGLSDSGREYRVFHERLARLRGLSISVQLTSDEGERHLTMHPLKRSFIPTRDEAHHHLGSRLAGQLMLTPRDYGFELDPDFYEYLRANPVPLPLPIMRAFHNSPKAWDFASLVLYRSYAARSTSVMTWTEPLQQIATNDAATRRLKATLAGVLREIRAIYPSFPRNSSRAARASSSSPGDHPSSRPAIAGQAALRHSKRTLTSGATPR